MAIVILDLKKYLKDNIFPSKTVLVFPPFNGFRRFLIHKLIEDNFASSEVGAFSIGQDINRRIVVCYKGLIRTDQNKVPPITIPKKSRLNMIETEGPSHHKSCPKVAVYRPPAARLAEARQKASEAKVDPPKRMRVRRPDQQMYVPRPKRSSFGNEQPRSRSSSRTSHDSDSCDKKKLSRRNDGDSVEINSNEAINFLPSSKQDDEKLVTKIPSHSPDEKDETLNFCKINSRLTLSKKDDSITDTNTEVRLGDPAINSDLMYTCSEPPLKSVVDVHCQSFPPKSDSNKPLDIPASRLRPSDNASSTETLSVKEIILDSSKEDNGAIAEKILQKGNKSHCEVDCNESLQEQESVCDRLKEIVAENNDISNSWESAEKDNIDGPKLGDHNRLEVMETISLSSESTCPTTTTSSSDSRDSSTDSKPVQNQITCKSGEKMDVEFNNDSVPTKGHDTTISVIEEDSKKKVILSNVQVTDDVLIISDSSSSNDNIKYSKEKSSEEKVQNAIPSSFAKEKIETSLKNKNASPGDSWDWESLYDDSGECLVPDLMEELTKSVGRVRVATADSDYRPYQSIEERTNDGECVIEIYDFPAEFKTTDLMNIFAAYRNKNFQLKWVDDTHALGVFPSPLMADEVLGCTLPFVKTRPLRFGITESRNKARNLILPPLPSMERPKTCTALARRLVTGALGLRLPTSSQDREKEKQVLKEAREKRRLEAKQREAAWDGTLTSTSCV